MTIAYPTRNVPILSAAQALAATATPMVVFIGGIMGPEMAPTRTLATLPASMVVVGLALTTIPASLLMSRIGRKHGFLFAMLLGVGSSLLAANALHRQEFGLYTLSAFLMGAVAAFIQQFRFAATESVPPERTSRAVSFVLVGGIVAGFLGPEIARRTMDLLPYGTFTAAFFIMAGLFLVTAGLLVFLQPTAAIQQQLSGEERPLRNIARQPSFLAAVLSGAAAYAVMSFIMTATPLQMHTVSHFSLDATAFVIESHIIAMYLPSLFTGFLIEKLGLTRLMLVGIALMVLTVAIGVVSREVLHYWWALVLLGLGWNFLFVGGTVLLTRSYYPAERFKAQAANDFTIFGSQALAALSAGSVLFLANWDVLLLLTLPILAGSALLVVRKTAESTEDGRPTTA
jgi:predicted MFS family arabinose efflux permease